MTVSTELSHEEYTGNGVTTDFDFRFRIFEAKHLVVSVADQGGTERILTNGTDYTLRGVGSYRGGKVILKMPLATGWKIGIARDLPAVQETDLRNQGKFFAEVHEDAFDYLTMLIQKSLGFLSLCLRKPSFISDHYDAKGNKISNLGKPVKDGDAVDLGTMKEHVSAKDKRSLRVADKDIPALPGAAVRANKLLSFDDNGNPVVIVPESGSAADVLAELGKPDGFGLVGGLTENYLRVFDNVAAMVAETSLPLGATVKTRGYYSPGDGGEGIYAITNNQPDALVNVNLDNGLTATLDVTNGVDILSVGAQANTDIGRILVGLQEIAAANTILIPKMSFDCNSQVKVKKNFRFSPGAQFINRSLRDDWFVFETDNIEFSTDGYGNKARIAVDNNLTGWNHSVALVIGKNNLRNLAVCNVNLVGCYTDHSGTALTLRADLSGDGSNDTTPNRRWNSITWCKFNNLSLEYCRIGLSVRAFEPKKEDSGGAERYMSWITSCQFRDLKIASAVRGVELLCVPIETGTYPKNTQIGEIQIDFVQQWMNDSKEAVYIDGAGQNKIEFFAWDYDGYTTKPSDAVIVKGSDGRDNFISGNMALKHVLFSSPENSYQLLYKSKEQNPILHRRICAIRHTGGGNYEIEKSYRIPFGINGVEKDPNDSYALIVNYDRGFGGFQMPYIICQNLNNTNGYSLEPFYNLSQSSTGKANFYIRKPGGASVSPLNEVPVGAIFIIEIICV
ncbi:hypothetical protein HMPREF3119_04205 [Morganella sp. HMSC11D09]|uniref:hypothetical protein n=1 Tax=Morganella sp. HMSC11D09 TaxID=1581087 RepID=UPI0008A53E5D|nr:hypothetical protein [Morganella sp. HMSC11D09]OFV02207.1 hypothetical protein HMPREF3119_04205 [Morganella sp. HMSC11D09]